MRKLIVSEFTHANAFEPMPAGDLMNAPKKYVVSKTLEKPIWRNTTPYPTGVVGLHYTRKR